MKKNKTLVILLLIIMVASPFAYIWWKGSQNVEESLDEHAPGQGPSDEYAEDLKNKCPLSGAYTENYYELSHKNSFQITDNTCPFLTTNEDLGEDVTVEIYTSDFEVGKQEFRDWLTEHGLEESEKLRVEYVHKP